MTQQPVVIGLKVCKDVIIDEKTRHVTLVNCVRKLRVQETPTRPEDYTVCCVLADGHGEITLTLKVMDLSNTKDIISRSWRFPMTKSLDERWLLIRLKDLVFPKPGRFEILLLADGQWLASSTIMVFLKGDS